jgi:hypothetical protein
MIPMTPRCAITIARSIERNTPFFDDPRDHEDYLHGLDHALECLEHMTKLLKYIRSSLPSVEPKLKVMITRQLLKGCDLE